MAKSSRLQDQPYEIQFSALGIASSAAYLFALVIISTTLVYLFIFVPLSYTSKEKIGTIWEFSVWLLWLISFFSALVYVGLKYLSKKESRWLWRIAFYSNWSILSILYALNFFGLYPASAFIPLIAILTTSCFFLFEQIFALALRYSHYLSRSMSFAEQGSVFLSLIAALNLFLIFGQGFRSLILWDTLFTPSTIVFIFQLISLVFITYFAANIELNNPRSSKFKVISSLFICVAVVIADYIDTGSLSFWWLGMASLSSAVFYTAHSPTKQKSTGLALGLYSMMTLAVIIDNITFRVSTNEIWNIVKDFIFPAVGIVATIVVAVPSFIKTVFPNLRSHKISKTDVAHGSQDFIEVDGFSVHALDQIMRIAIISNEFSYCEKLLGEQRKFPSSELYEYFEIYYLCVQFTHAKQVVVEITDDDFNKHNIAITARNDFITYINDRFPHYISSYDVWDGYFTKGYISKYISEKKLSQSRPTTTYTQITTYVKNAFIVLLIFLTFSSQVIAPWMNVLPSLVSKAATWNSTRKNETRLLLVSVAKPYLVDDSEIRTYYAFSMWNWIQNREMYIGETVGETLYMSNQEMEIQIEYLKSIFEFYGQKDNFYFRLSNEIGSYYKGLDDCQTALGYFEIVLNDTSSPVSYKDSSLAKKAECFIEQDSLSQAIDTLQESYKDTDYVLSRSLLAKIYYEQDNYGEVVNLLKPISGNINSHSLSILGESLYWMKEFGASLEILESVASTSIDAESRIRNSLYIGAVNDELNKPFIAAEYYYEAFSGQICPYTPALTSQEQEIFLPQFKSTIDIVSKENPSDHRTDLWNFVYFLYIDDIDTAIGHLKLHLGNSPEYEQAFVQCFLDMIEKK